MQSDFGVDNVSGVWGRQTSSSRRQTRSIQRCTAAELARCHGRADSYPARNNKLTVGYSDPKTYARFGTTPNDSFKRHAYSELVAGKQSCGAERMMMHADSCKQRGVTLVVTLIMLVLLTLFAISAINSAMINLRIAGNMQFQDEARAAGQVAIERYISSLSNFQPPVARTINVDLNNDGTTDFAVAVSQPKCMRAALQKPPRSTQCAPKARNPTCFAGIRSGKLRQRLLILGLASVKLPYRVQLFPLVRTLFRPPLVANGF